jgi:F-type H+-transporting ATPase subunit delta
MLTGALARRYARALFELAVEMSVLDQIDHEIRFLSDLIAQNDELKYLLNHPNIDAAAKKEVLGNILDNHVSDMSKRFFFLLIDRRRQNMLAMIEREFIRLANETRHLVEAKIVSAVPLSLDQEQKIKQVIAKTTGKNVQLTAEVNPMLIGGARLQIGDQVIDGSVAAALSKLRRELTKSSYKPQQEIGVS